MSTHQPIPNIHGPVRVMVNTMRLTRIIDMTNKSVPQFALAANLSPNSVYKALRGEEVSSRIRRRLLEYCRSVAPEESGWDDLFYVRGYDSRRGVPGS